MSVGCGRGASVWSSSVMCPPPACLTNVTLTVTCRQVSVSRTLYPEQEGKTCHSTDKGRKQGEGCVSGTGPHSHRAAQRRVGALPEPWLRCHDRGGRRRCGGRVATDVLPLLRHQERRHRGAVRRALRPMGSRRSRRTDGATSHRSPARRLAP